MFQPISIQHPAFYQTAENCISRFSTFSVKGDQKWEKTQKRHFVGFVRNIQSPHQITLERAEGVAVNPLLL